MGNAATWAFWFRVWNSISKKISKVPGLFWCEGVMKKERETKDLARGAKKTSHFPFYDQKSNTFFRVTKDKHPHFLWTQKWPPPNLAVVNSSPVSEDRRIVGILVWRQARSEKLDLQILAWELVGSINHYLVLEGFAISMFPKIVVPPKSSILIGFSIITYPFWGSPIFGNTHMSPALGGLENHHPKNGWKWCELPVFANKVGPYELIVINGVTCGPPLSMAWK